MLTYEPARESDVPLLFSLNRQLIDQYEDLASVDYDRAVNWTYRSVLRNLPSFCRILWNGELAGFYCLIREEGKWELDSLFVLPPYQGKGIGTQVLTLCQQQASPLFLYVFQKNTGALTLYQRMGFRIVKTVGTSRCRMKYTRPSRLAKFFLSNRRSC